MGIFSGSWRVVVRDEISVLSVKHSGTYPEPIPNENVYIDPQCIPERYTGRDALADAVKHSIADTISQRNCIPVTYCLPVRLAFRDSELERNIYDVTGEHGIHVLKYESVYDTLENAI